MMIRVIFSSLFFIIISAADIRDSEIERQIEKALQTKNISDESLLLDLRSFVSYNGIRRSAKEANESKEALRMWPKYYLPVDADMRRNVFDIMRQSLYTTQERMVALDPILQKYENDPALRMSFIHNRLRQLLIDMRRIYTFSKANAMSYKHPVYQFIYLYSHMVRKYFDVLYIVEHAIAHFSDYMKSMMKGKFHKSENTSFNGTLPNEEPNNSTSNPA